MVNRDAYEHAQHCIETIIDNGGVLIAGVDHHPKRGINEGTTDHFIVITGYEIMADGTKYYRYLETGTSLADKQYNSENRLYCNDEKGRIEGITPKVPEEKYTITQVRPNDGKVWAGTTNLCP